MDSNQSKPYPTTTTNMHKIDPELKCFSCKRYFQCPLLLPCGHSLCNQCAAGALLPTSNLSVAKIIRTISQLMMDPDNFSSSNSGGQQLVENISATNSSSSSTSSAIGSTIGGLSTTNQHSNPIMSGCSNISIPSDSDQQSVNSETDSGVVVTNLIGNNYSNKLPVILCSNSIGPVWSQANNPNSFQYLNQIIYGLNCFNCNQIVALLDNKGIGRLPRNYALERIIKRLVNPKDLTDSTNLKSTFENLEPFLFNSNLDPIDRIGGPLCQLCEPAENQTASVWCEQCEIFYCTTCRNRCHPAKGPLTRHVLHESIKAVEIIKIKRGHNLLMCFNHSNVIPTLYCVTCNLIVCHECLTPNPDQLEIQHSKHEIQPLIGVCKSKKVS